MDDRKPEICRLCLKAVSEIYHYMNVNQNDMIQIILPSVNLDVCGNGFICEECDKSLSEAFAFKTSCLEIEDNIHDYTNNGTTQVNLEKVLGLEDSDEGTITKICRTCLEVVDYDSFEWLIVDDKCLLTQMFQKCIPEMNLELTKNPVLCQTCKTSIKNNFKFVSQCIENEERITDYIKTNPPENFNLFDIQTFLFCEKEPEVVMNFIHKTELDILQDHKEETVEYDNDTTSRQYDTDEVDKENQNCSNLNESNHIRANENENITESAEFEQEFNVEPALDVEPVSNIEQELNVEPALNVEPGLDVEPALNTEPVLNVESTLNIEKTSNIEKRTDKSMGIDVNRDLSSRPNNDLTHDENIDVDSDFSDGADNDLLFEGNHDIDSILSEEQNNDPIEKESDNVINTELGNRKKSDLHFDSINGLSNNVDEVTNTEQRNINNGVRGGNLQNDPNKKSNSDTALNHEGADNSSFTNPENGSSANPKNDNVLSIDSERNSCDNSNTDANNGQNKDLSIEPSKNSSTKPSNHSPEMDESDDVQIICDDTTISAIEVDLTSDEDRAGTEKTIRISINRPFSNISIKNEIPENIQSGDDDEQIPSRGTGKRKRVYNTRSKKSRYKVRVIESSDDDDTGNDPDFRVRADDQSETDDEEFEQSSRRARGGVRSATRVDYNSAGSVGVNSPGGATTGTNNDAQSRPLQMNGLIPRSLPALPNGLPLSSPFATNMPNNWVNYQSFVSPDGQQFVGIQQFFPVISNGTLPNQQLATSNGMFPTQQLTAFRNQLPIQNMQTRLAPFNPQAEAPNRTLIPVTQGTSRSHQENGTGSDADGTSLYLSSISGTFKRIQSKVSISQIPDDTPDSHKHAQDIRQNPASSKIRNSGLASKNIRQNPASSKNVKSTMGPEQLSKIAAAIRQKRDNLRKSLVKQRRDADKGTSTLVRPNAGQAAVGSSLQDTPSNKNSQRQENDRSVLRSALKKTSSRQRLLKNPAALKRGQDIQSLIGLVEVEGSLPTTKSATTNVQPMVFSCKYCGFRETHVTAMKKHLRFCRRGLSSKETSSHLKASPLKATHLKATPLNASHLKATLMKAPPLIVPPLKVLSKKATPKKAPPKKAPPKVTPATPRIIKTLPFPVNFTCKLCDYSSSSENIFNIHKLICPKLKMIQYNQTEQQNQLAKEAGKSNQPPSKPDNIITIDEEGASENSVKRMLGTRGIFNKPKYPIRLSQTEIFQLLKSTGILTCPASKSKNNNSLPSDDSKEKDNKSTIAAASKEDQSSKPDESSSAGVVEDKLVRNEIISESKFPDNQSLHEDELGEQLNPPPSFEAVKDSDTQTSELKSLQNQNKNDKHHTKDTGDRHLGPDDTPCQKEQLNELASVDKGTTSLPECTTSEIDKPMKEVPDLLLAHCEFATNQIIQIKMGLEKQLSKGNTSMVENAENDELNETILHAKGSGDVSESATSKDSMCQELNETFHHAEACDDESVSAGPEDSVCQSESIDKMLESEILTDQVSSSVSISQMGPRSKSVLIDKQLFVDLSKDLISLKNQIGHSKVSKNELLRIGIADYQISSEVADQTTKPTSPANKPFISVVRSSDEQISEDESPMDMDNFYDSSESEENQSSMTKSLDKDRIMDAPSIIGEKENTLESSDATDQTSVPVSLSNQPVVSDVPESDEQQISEPTMATSEDKDQRSDVSSICEEEQSLKSSGVIDNIFIPLPLAYPPVLSDVPASVELISEQETLMNTNKVNQPSASKSTAENRMLSTPPPLCEKEPVIEPLTDAVETSECVLSANEPDFSGEKTLGNESALDIEHSDLRATEKKQSSKKPVAEDQEANECEATKGADEKTPEDVSAMDIEHSDLPATEEMQLSKKPVAEDQKANECEAAKSADVKTSEYVSAMDIEHSDLPATEETQSTKKPVAEDQKANEFEAAKSADEKTSEDESAMDIEHSDLPAPEKEQSSKTSVANAQKANECRAAKSGDEKTSEDESAMNIEHSELPAPEKKQSSKTPVANESEAAKTGDEKTYEDESAMDIEHSDLPSPENEQSSKTPVAKDQKVNECEATKIADETNKSTSSVKQTENDKQTLNTSSAQTSKAVGAKQQSAVAAWKHSESHKTSVTPKKVPQERIKKFEIPKDLAILKCDSCPFNTRNHFRMETHVLSHLSQLKKNNYYSCSMCKTVFVDLELFNEHLKVKHHSCNYKVFFWCVSCAKVFKQKPDLTQHLRACMHRDKIVRLFKSNLSIFCMMCDFETTNINLARAHLQECREKHAVVLPDVIELD